MARQLAEPCALPGVGSWPGLRSVRSRRRGWLGLGPAPVAGFHRCRTCPLPNALVTGGLFLRGMTVLEEQPHALAPPRRKWTSVVV